MTGPGGAGGDLPCALRGSEELGAHPLAASESGSFGGSVALCEFVAGEADDDGVAAGVVALLRGGGNPMRDREKILDDLAYTAAGPATRRRLADDVGPLLAELEAAEAENVRLRAAVDAALLTLKLPAPTEAHRNDEARAILRAAQAGVEQETEPTGNGDCWPGFDR